MAADLDLAKADVVLELKEHFTLKSQTLPNPGFGNLTTQLSIFLI